VVACSTTALKAHRWRHKDDDRTRVVERDRNSGCWPKPTRRASCEQPDRNIRERATLRVRYHGCEADVPVRVSVQARFTCVEAFAAARVKSKRGPSSHNSSKRHDQTWDSDRPNGDRTVMTPEICYHFQSGSPRRVLRLCLFEEGSGQPTCRCEDRCCQRNGCFFHGHRWRRVFGSSR